MQKNTLSLQHKINSIIPYKQNMKQLKLILLLSIAILVVKTATAQNKAFQITAASYEINAAPGLRNRSNDEYLRFNLFATAFNKVNFKIGHGVLSSYHTNERNLFETTMQTFSIIPYIQPINTKRVHLYAGIGLSEIRYHARYSDMSGTIDIGDGPMMVHRIKSTTSWKLAWDFNFDLDYKLTEHVHMGAQFGFLSITKKIENFNSEAFSAGFKAKYVFKTNH